MKWKSYSAACLLVSVKNTCSYMVSPWTHLVNRSWVPVQNHWDPVKKQWVSPKLKMLRALRDQTVKRYSFVKHSEDYIKVRMRHVFGDFYVWGTRDGESVNKITTVSKVSSEIKKETWMSQTRCVHFSFYSPHSSRSGSKNVAIFLTFETCLLNRSLKTTVFEVY